VTPALADQTSSSIGFAVKNQYFTGTAYPNINLVKREALSSGNWNVTSTKLFIPTANFKYFGYFKLQKQGTLFTFSVSDDEITWQELGTATMNFTKVFLCFF
jgi:hypothetical protein